MNTDPKISIVVTARNDNYGGKLIQRTRASIDVLRHLSQKFRVPTEYILVEYNPGKDKELLFHELGILDAPYFKCRALIVPESFHLGFDTRIPVLEYIAKNIGIRRARGTFILATNPDIIVSEPLFTRFSGEIRNDTFYCAYRHDLTVDEFPDSMPPAGILAACPHHVGKKMYTPRTHYVSYRVWFNRLIHGRTMRDFSFCPLFNSLYPRDARLIHENAAGDFLLAHRAVWESARGYDETPHNLHHDSLLLYNLQALGYEQRIFEEPIFHINHRIGRAGRPGTSYAEYRKRIRDIQETKQPQIMNTEDWGFRNEHFEELDSACH